MKDYDYNKEIIDKILKDIHESRLYLERIAKATEEQRITTNSIRTAIIIVIAWLIGIAITISIK